MRARLFNTVAAKLCSEYPGLDKEKLCQMNPEYSCYICNSLECPKHKLGRPNRACIKHVKITQEEWLKRTEG